MGNKLGKITYLSCFAYLLYYLVNDKSPFYSYMENKRNNFWEWYYSKKVVLNRNKKEEEFKGNLNEF